MKTLKHALAAIAEAGKLDPAEARERYALAMDIVQMQLHNKETEDVPVPEILARC